MFRLAYKKFFFVSTAIVLLHAVANFSLAEPSGELRIGVIAPLTGVAAEHGEYIREGFELAREELSSRYNLKIFYEDDACTGTKGVTAVKTLTEVHQVDAIFGSWCSGVVLAVAPVVEKKQVVLMGCVTSPQVSQAGDFVFRIHPEARVFIKNLVPYLVKVKKQRLWAILNILNDFGADQADVFEKQLSKAGGKTLIRESYLPDTRDFRSQLLKIKKRKPEGVFIPGYAEVAVILKQARELGIKAQFAASNTFENQSILENAGDAAEGVIFASPFDPDSTLPSVRTFQSKYQKKFSRPAESIGMLAYDGLKLLTQVLSRCKKDHVCVRKTLYQETFLGVNGEYSFDSYGDSIRPISLRSVKGGKFITLSKDPD